MFVLAHLLVGVLIGILLYLWRRERWLILAAAVGSILPDLIDKPLGHIFLAGTVNFGRIYFHSLIFLLAFIIAGLLIWWKFRSFIGIALALGVLSHQVLDRMWAAYWNWLWPFFGPFRGESIENYFLFELIQELTNFSEWIFGLALLLILVSLARIETIGMPMATGNPEKTETADKDAADHSRVRSHPQARIQSWVRDHPRLFLAFAGTCVFLLALVGVFAIYCGFSGIPCLLTGLDYPADNLLLGTLMIVEALVLGWIDLWE
jgi:hypothetical protein